METHVARGTPHRRITGPAKRLHADVIVVGSRGESPLRNRLIGGTVRNVARTAVRPLLVERIESSGETHEVRKEHLFRDVSHVTNFSSNAERAFEFLPRLEGAIRRAYLLSVRSREQKNASVSAEELRDRLAGLAADLEARMDVETSVDVRDGVAVEELLGEERRVDATSTLLGARGTSRLRRLLLGSTSESIVAQGRNNVILVPPDGERPR